jgi:hypothetical protein
MAVLKFSTLRNRGRGAVGRRQVGRVLPDMEHGGNAVSLGRQVAIANGTAAMRATRFNVNLGEVQRHGQVAVRAAYFHLGIAQIVTNLCELTPTSRAGYRV